MKPLFDLSFRKIQYYLMVVEEGSLTRAAKRLFISQPMLSKAVKELEQELAIQARGKISGGHLCGPLSL